MGKVIGIFKTHPMTALIDRKLSSGIVRTLLSQ